MTKITCTRSKRESAKDSVKIVQVANIAPLSTKEQMQSLFGHVGKIERFRLYPTINLGLQFQSKMCFVKFFDSSSVDKALHLTNTVFIDRALMVIPYSDDDVIPEETRALELLVGGTLLPGIADPKLPQHVTSHLEGLPPLQMVITNDPKLAENNLPPYPPLPTTIVNSRKIEEIRRTIMICNIAEGLSADDVMKYFSNAGEVKYFRFCTRDNDPLRYALIEFSEQPSVLEALKFNGQYLSDKVIRVYHATQAIIKPQAKTNEAAQKEIQEAMSRQEQDILSYGLEIMTETATPTKKQRSRSSSLSRSSRGSKGRKRLRSKSKDRRRSRSKSRKCRRSRSRPKKRRRSRSRSRGYKESRSRSRGYKESRSRSRGYKESRSRSRGYKESRSRSRGYKESRSRNRKRSCSKSHRSSSRHHEY